MLAVLLLSYPATAQNASENESVTLVMFWREGCPHCEAEKEFLAELHEKYPRLNVELYEATSNLRLFQEYAGRYNASTQWVPITFIGDEVISGFNNKWMIGADIERQVKYELNLLNTTECVESEKGFISVPFLGKVDPSGVSLPALTVVIGLLDGFNPCAMWVLMFLLTMLVHAKSRKRMMVIGGVFVTVSAVIYFLFMAAWLNVFLLVGFEGVTRIIIGLVAVAAGIINLKDFFWFKQGVSLSIPESAKPKLFKKMRSVVNEQAVSAMVAGTIVLAVFVNFIELACTAGLPAIYTRILTMRNLHPLQYYGYLALYNVLYVVPLMIIVAVFVYTMGSRKLSEKEGRILKLFAGLLMLTLGLLLLFNPQVLTLG